MDIDKLIGPTLVALGLAIIESNLHFYHNYLLYYTGWVVIALSLWTPKPPLSIKDVIASIAYVFSVEDALYWVLVRELPFQWVWWYVVIDHIPIVTVVVLVVSVVVLVR
jgi:hypothetical protein